MMVMMEQITARATRMARAHIWKPPCTATTQNTHTSTPAEEKSNIEVNEHRTAQTAWRMTSKYRERNRSIGVLLVHYWYYTSTCVWPNTLVQMLTTKPERWDGSWFLGQRTLLRVQRSWDPDRKSALLSLMESASVSSWQLAIWYSTITLGCSGWYLRKRERELKQSFT